MKFYAFLLPPIKVGTKWEVRVNGSGRGDEMVGTGQLFLFGSISNSFLRPVLHEPKNRIQWKPYTPRLYTNLPACHVLYSARCHLCLDSLYRRGLVGPGFVIPDKFLSPPFIIKGGIHCHKSELYKESWYCCLVTTVVT